MTQHRSSLSAYLPWVLIAVVVLSFYPALQNSLLDWDDKSTIITNPHLHGWTFSNLTWAWTTFHMGPYQPLSWMSLALDHWIWGLNPLGYHLTQVMLHTINTGLLYLILLVLLRSPVAACLGALLFGVHPLRVESVAWATERRDVLSGLFFLASWLSYLRFHQRKATGLESRSWPAASILLFLMAIVSKATAVGLLWVLIMSDLLALHRLPLSWKEWGRSRYRGVWLEKAPYVLAAFLVGVIGWMGARQVGLFFHPYSWMERLALFVYGATFYVQKILAPWNLSALYQMPLDLAAWKGEFFARGLLFTAITWILFRNKRNHPIYFYGWAAYLLILLPVSGIAQNGRQLAADRYTYLSCLPLVWMAGHFLARRGRRWAAAGLAVVVLMALTWRQCGFWKNDLTLWSHAISVDPNNRVAHYNLGTQWMSRNPSEAMRAFQTVLTLDPNDADAHFNIAMLYNQSGQPHQAADHYRSALRVRPNSLQTLNNLASTWMTLGHYSEAMHLLNDALTIDSGFAEARFNRGVLWMIQGEKVRGQADIDQAVASRPDLWPRTQELPSLLKRLR